MTEEEEKIVQSGEFAPDRNTANALEKEVPALQHLIEDYLHTSSCNPDPLKQSLESPSYPLYSLGDNRIQQMLVRANKREVSGSNVAHIELSMNYHGNPLSLYLNMNESARGISGLSAESELALRTLTGVYYNPEVDDDTEKFLGDQLEPQALQALANIYKQPVTSVKLVFPEYGMGRLLRERGYAADYEYPKIYTKVFTPQS